VLVNFRDGGPDPVVFREAPAQIHAVAFWHALIGQQDRHGGNFQYDPTARRLAAIDSAFAFVRPGDFINNGSLFIEYRRSTNGDMLDGEEKNTLQDLLDHDFTGCETSSRLTGPMHCKRASSGCSRRVRLPASGEFQIFPSTLDVPSGAGTTIHPRALVQRLWCR
jgi:hypothetical protein